MDRRVGGHGMQERDVINTSCQIREQVADPLATFTVFFEFSPWLDDAAFVLFSAPTKRLDRHDLAIHAVHVRFVVKCIDMTWATVHEQENHRFCFGCKMWFFRCQGIAVEDCSFTLGRLEPVASSTFEKSA